MSVPPPRTNRTKCLQSPQWAAAVTTFSLCLLPTSLWSLCYLLLKMFLKKLYIMYMFKYILFVLNKATNFVVWGQCLLWEIIFSSVGFFVVFFLPQWLQDLFFNSFRDWWNQDQERITCFDNMKPRLTNGTASTGADLRKACRLSMDTCGWTLATNAYVNLCWQHVDFQVSFFGIVFRGRLLEGRGGYSTWTVVWMMLLS